MSHITTVELTVTNLEAVRLAAIDCGMTLRLDQHTHKWWGHWVGDSPLPAGVKVEDLGKCDHAISVDGRRDAYEIGLVKVGDQFRLQYDFWQGGFGLEAAAGAGCQKLLQRYGLHVARMAAEDAGMDWTEEVLADGTIQMVVSTPQQQQVGAW